MKLVLLPILASAVTIYAMDHKGPQIIGKKPTVKSLKELAFQALMKSERDFPLKILPQEFQIMCLDYINPVIRWQHIPADTVPLLPSKGILKARFLGQYFCFLYKKRCGNDYADSPPKKKKIPSACFVDTTKKWPGEIALDAIDRLTMVRFPLALFDGCGDFKDTVLSSLVASPDGKRLLVQLKSDDMSKRWLFKCEPNEDEGLFLEKISSEGLSSYSHAIFSPDSKVLSLIDLRGNLRSISSSEGCVQQAVRVFFGKGENRPKLFYNRSGRVLVLNSNRILRIFSSADLHRYVFINNLTENNGNGLRAFFYNDEVIAGSYLFTPCRGSACFIARVKHTLTTISSVTYKIIKDEVLPEGLEPRWEIGCGGELLCFDTKTKKTLTLQPPYAIERLLSFDSCFMKVSPGRSFFLAMKAGDPSKKSDECMFSVLIHAASKYCRPKEVKEALRKKSIADSIKKFSDDGTFCAVVGHTWAAGYYLKPTVTFFKKVHAVPKEVTDKTCAELKKEWRYTKEELRKISEFLVLDSKDKKV